jgi:hypothetical protein
VEAEVVWKTWPALVAALILSPTNAGAQTAWDAAGFAGLFIAHTDASATDGYAEDWSNAAQGGAVFGRYLTPHFKLELEASTTSRGVQYASTPVSVPGLPYPYWLYTEVRTSVRSLSSVGVWQFRDNEWVHPFVLAGVSADWDASFINVPPQIYHGDPRSPSALVAEGRTEERTDVHVRGVFGGGAKLYFTERAFVRSDARFTWGADRQHLVLRAGIGIDF